MRLECAKFFAVLVFFDPLYFIYSYLHICLSLLTLINVVLRKRGYWQRLQTTILMEKKSK